MVKVKVDKTGIAPKLASIASDSGLGTFAAEEMGKGMNPYVPMETGVLSQFYATKPFHVLYLAAYSTRLYHGEGMNISQEMHPLATAKWDKAYIADKKGQLTKSLQDYISRM